MKYCAKCGNPMEDDMMFCQKCGTRFEGTVSSPNGIVLKIEKMKKYNLVLDSSTFTWEYLREDGERAGNICVKQDNLCVEFCDLIKGILSEIDGDEKDIIEREVYTYVLKMGYKMCKEGEKLFANYSGFKELFDMGNNLVRSGQLDAGTFLNQMLQQDMAYKCTAGLQGLHASRIKGALDVSVIENNIEFQNLTKDLATAYNSMWSKCIKRYTDFFLSPGEDFINTNWEQYEVIIEGLPQKVVDGLDESGWDFALNDWERNHNGRQYKENFNRKRKQKREAKRSKEKEIEDKKYWESHPDEYKMVEEKNAEIKEINVFISEKNKEISALEQKQYPAQAKKTDLEKEIQEKKIQIEKFSKKIFGKKKAEENIQILNQEITMIEQQIEEVKKEITGYETPLAAINDERNDLQQKIRKLEQEIRDLRNK